MSADVTSRGGCLCGAVRFATEGRLLFCAHCHCQWCRRAHGAAFVTWYGVPEGSFRLTSEANALRWHSSSEQSQRGFCSTCGTTLFYRSTLAPGEVHIALACADAPNEIVPTCHVFYEARVSWAVTSDDLPRYDRDQAGLSKYQVIARAPST